MNSVLRTLLFLSAYAPILFSLAYVKYSAEGWTTGITQLVVIGILGTALPYLIVEWLAKNGELLSFKAKKIEDAGFMLFGFVFGYVSPLILKSLGYDFESALWAVSFLGIVFWLIPNIPAHPILRLIKIRFYKVEAENGMVYTVISRDELRSVSDLKHVHIISSAMLLKAKL